MTWHPSNADGTVSKWGAEHKVLNHKVSDIQYLLQGRGGGKILTSKHHWSVSKQTEQLIIIIITIIAAALVSSSSRGKKKNVLGLFLIVTWDLKYFTFSSSECKPSTHTHTHACRCGIHPVLSDLLEGSPTQVKIWGLQQLWISTTATNIGAKLKIKSVTNALECLKLTRTVNILFPVTAIIPDPPKKTKEIPNFTEDSCN